MKYSRASTSICSRNRTLNAVILKHNIDSAFITHLEQRSDDTIKFERIDADVNADALKEEVSEEDLKEDTDTLTDVFRKALGNDKLEVKVEKLKNASVSSMITLSEESTPYAGYDEDVQYVRYGSVHVRRSLRHWF